MSTLMLSTCVPCLPVLFKPSPRFPLRKAPWPKENEYTSFSLFFQSGIPALPGTSIYLADLFLSLSSQIKARTLLFLREFFF